MPAYSALHVDHEANLWVRVYAAEGELVSVWHVFDDDGRWLGPVELQAGLQVTDIGADYVLGIVRDESGVEYVQLHSIEK